MDLLQHIPDIKKKTEMSSLTLSFPRAKTSDVKSMQSCKFWFPEINNHSSLDLTTVPRVLAGILMISNVLAISRGESVSASILRTRITLK